MSCDIFIRSYAKDFDWLAYCLGAVERFGRGFGDVILVVPESSRHAVAQSPWLGARGIRLEFCPDAKDDYLGQQVTKLLADTYARSDLICHLDADCILARTTTPVDLAPDGKPGVVLRAVAQLGRHRPWLASTERFLGWTVEHDFMQQPPFTYPRWLYGEVREFCRRRHGVDIEQYVLSQPPRGFSEFNVLGAYAHRHHPDSFAWTEREPSQADNEGPCRWYWSWGGLDPGTRAEIEAGLG